MRRAVVGCSRSLHEQGRRDAARGSVDERNRDFAAVIFLVDNWPRYISMKTWLRLTVVAMTVGGGFTGLAFTLQTLLHPHNQKFPSLLSMIVFLALYGYVTVSGLIFVQNSSRTAPVLAALALQVPSFSSPVVTYIFVSGLSLFVGITGPQRERAFAHFQFDLWWGSSWRFSFFQDDAWRIGANLVALILFVLIWKSREAICEPAPTVTALRQEPTRPAESPSS